MPVHTREMLHQVHKVSQKMRTVTAEASQVKHHPDMMDVKGECRTGSGCTGREGHTFIMQRWVSGQLQIPGRKADLGSMREHGSWLRPFLVGKMTQPT